MNNHSCPNKNRKEYPIKQMNTYHNVFATPSKLCGSIVNIFENEILVKLEEPRVIRI